MKILVFSKKGAPVEHEPAKENITLQNGQIRYIDSGITYSITEDLNILPFESVIVDTCVNIVDNSVEVETLNILMSKRMSQITINLASPILNQKHSIKLQLTSVSPKKETIPKDTILFAVVSK